MTDSEKLAQVREYVEGMTPVVRAAILRSPDQMIRDRGYDEAMGRAQQELLRILDE